MTGSSTESGDSYRDRLARAIGSGFELGRLLGQGGFAEVFAARDATLNREIAIKVLRRDLAGDPTIAERFRREAEAVAGINHPNIVPIYSVGEGDGLAYFVMPIVAGESLRAWLEREPQPAFEDVRRVLIEAAGALAAAHRHGVIHRDIKPDNIMLDGPDRRVLVMDFGIAKAMSDADTGLTATGMIIGTPQYMSPEQGTGDGRIDARSDLYSLGVVGYQMITGQLPFAGSTVVALLMQHATEPPPPILELRPDCPGAVAGAVQRCLAKDPAARWRTAEDLRDALSGTAPARDEPVVEARPSGPLSPPGKVRRRFRIVVPVALITTAMAFVVDLAVAPGVQFAPLVAVGALFVAVAAYGRARVDGLSWRDLVGAGEAPRRGPGEQHTSEGADFGEYLMQLQRVRADRAALLGSLARLPNSERRVLEDILPAADRLLAQATTLARKLNQTELAIAKGVAREDRPQAEARQRELIVQFTTTADAMHQVRSALRRVATEGPSSVGEGIREVVRGAALTA